MFVRAMGRLVKTAAVLSLVPLTFTALSWFQVDTSWVTSSLSASLGEVWELVGPPESTYAAADAEIAPVDPAGPVDVLEVAEARQRLEVLDVDVRHRGGYDRSLFGESWVTVEGCSVRELVLAAESVSGTFDPATCVVERGGWSDWYSESSPIISDASSIDIDHMVPLAHAWQAGAYQWDSERRHAFANDYHNAASLTAVSAVQNRTKSASPPDVWQPTVAARCRYGIDWIATKTVWSLTVTTAESAALEQMLNYCPETSQP